MVVKHILGSLLLVSVAFLTSVGCGPQEVAVPAEDPASEQNMDEYYKKLEEAEAKGVDPSTIPAP